MEYSYCPYCGRELKRRNLIYCPYCGQKLQNTSPQQSQQSLSPQQTPPDDNLPPKQVTPNKNQQNIINNQPLPGNTKLPPYTPIQRQGYPGYPPMTSTQNISYPADITKAPIYYEKPKIKLFTSKDVKLLSYHFSGVYLGVFFRFLLINDKFPGLNDYFDFVRISLYVSLITIFSLKYAFIHNGVFVKSYNIVKEHVFQVTLATTFFLGYVPDIYNLKETKKIPVRKKGEVMTTFVILLLVFGLFFMFLGLVIFKTPPQSTFLILLYGLNTKLSSVPFITGEILMATSFIMNLDASFSFGNEIKEAHPRLSSLIRTGIIIVLFLMLSGYLSNIFSIT